MTRNLSPKRCLLCRFVSDLKIWKSTNALGPKAGVLGVSFTWTPERRLGPVLAGISQAGLACSTAASHFGIQAFLPRSRKSCLLRWALKVEGSRDPKSFQWVYTRGRMAQWLKMELVDGQLCSLPYSPGRCLGTILSHCFQNRIVPLLCAVMFADGHVCVQEIHKLFIAIYIFKQQKKISFSTPLSQETEFWSILFMKLTNEQIKPLLYTSVMCRLHDWKRNHYFN